MNTPATMTMRNANYLAREPFRFTRHCYVADNGRLYRGGCTYALVTSGLLVPRPPRLRLSLINLINRNHTAIRARFCACINARANGSDNIVPSKRKSFCSLSGYLLSRAASIKQKDLYRRSLNLITRGISH